MRRALARHLKEWTYGLVAREISQITRYADRVVHVDPLPSDTGLLLDGLDAPAKYMGASEAAAGILRDEPGVAIALFNGNLNHSTDIQKLLEGVRPHLSRHGRVVVVLYNAYLSWLFRLADWAGLRQGPELITLSPEWISFSSRDYQDLSSCDRGRWHMCRGISSAWARL